ncbi:MAG: hypothetical protein DI539_02785 [Flavobacterium psychrophilum]|nr:MAG: hypothetical protein DI539_02785 [Flavobacterium psychrophilum]
MKTREEIREIGIEYLKLKNRKYSFIHPAEAVRFYEKDEILFGRRKGEYLDVFEVSYDFTVVNQERGALIYIDAETGEVLYTLSSHGWVEDALG